MMGVLITVREIHVRILSSVRYVEQELHLGDHIHIHIKLQGRLHNGNSIDDFSWCFSCWY